MKVQLITISIAILSCLQPLNSASTNNLTKLDSSSLIEDIWQYYQYKQKFNKSHHSFEEEQNKFNAFRENLKKMNEFNACPGVTYRQGLNQFTDLTHDEFLHSRIIQNESLIIQAISDDSTSCNSFNFDKESNETDIKSPLMVDYSNDSRRVGPIRDQGSCASGWAIATTGLLEGLEIRNRTYEVIPLSVQNILDCDHYDRGCSGGDVEWALQAIKDEGGLETEETYPYEANNSYNNCRYNKYQPFVTTMYLKTVTNLISGDEKQLERVVATYGPVAVALDASRQSFMNYQSGVYFDTECKNNTRNHHMLVVGFGITEDGQEYWKLKNSWSSNWGMSGYMLLARNKNNHCGIATKATIVQISND